MLRFFVATMNGDLRELTMQTTAKITEMIALSKTAFDLPSSCTVRAILDSTSLHVGATLSDVGVVNGCVVHIIIKPVEDTSLLVSVDQTVVEICRWGPELILEQRRLDDKPTSIMIISKCGTGKTELIRTMLFHLRKHTCGIAFDLHCGEYGSRSPFFPKNDFYENFSYNARQKSSIVQENKGVMVFDQMDHDHEFKTWSCDILKEHKGTVIKTRQFAYYTKIDADFDFVILFRDNIVSNRLRLYEQFFQTLAPELTFDDFSQLMDQVCSRFTCLVLDNTNESKNITDRLFWYEADVTTHPVRVICTIVDNKIYDVQFEDSGEIVEGVNAAYLVGLNSESVSLRFRNTWMTLPPDERHCFVTRK